MNRAVGSNLLEAEPGVPDDELPFLLRWSRRKLGQQGALVTDEATSASEVVPAVVEPDAAVTQAHEPIDPRSGKPMSELTDEDMPEVESLDENSDLAAFMAGKVSRALRMKALSRVFHGAKFNQVCLCAEYADDYTHFTPLGDIVPHDLKQAIVREAAKLCERLAEGGVTISPEQAQARVAAEYRGERVPALAEFAAHAGDPRGESSGLLPAPLDEAQAVNQPSGRTLPPGHAEAT